MKIERRHREALHTRCESKLKANMISKLGLESQFATEISATYDVALSVKLVK